VHTATIEFTLVVFNACPDPPHPGGTAESGVTKTVEQKTGTGTGKHTSGLEERTARTERMAGTADM
jgi:hypothetical protein